MQLQLVLLPTCCATRTSSIAFTSAPSSSAARVSASSPKRAAVQRRCSAGSWGNGAGREDPITDRMQLCARDESHQKAAVESAAEQAAREGQRTTAFSLLASSSVFSCAGACTQRQASIRYQAGWPVNRSVLTRFEGTRKESARFAAAAGIQASMRCVSRCAPSWRVLCRAS